MLAYFRSAVRRQVIVTTKTDNSFKGILYRKRGPLLILRNAELLTGRDAKAIDGELLLERVNVDFMQVVG